MSYPLFKVVHILGVLLLFAGLGGAVLLQLGEAANERGRKLAGLTHGIAMVLILIAGFGALGKLGAGFPPWAMGKLVLWLILAAAPVVIRKARGLAPVLWWVLPLFGAAAALFAIYKPGG